MPKQLRLIGLAAVMVAAIGCGGSGHTDSATPSAAPQTRLLTAADVGAGWKPGQPINAQDLAAFAQVPCERGSLSTAIAKRLTGVTGAQFEPIDRSYRHLIELIVTGSAGQLDTDMQTLFGALESCSPETLAIPALGDQRAAYTFIQQQPRSATAISLRAAYVRVGAVAVLIGLADFQATEQGKSQVSDDAFVQILRRAVARLSA